MALSFRAASGGNQAATSATSQAITLPTGTAANDLVYFIVSVGVGTVSGASATGWTLTTTNDATGATSTIVGYRQILSGDTGPTVSWTNAGRAAWTAVALQPGAGNVGAHSGYATPTNTGVTGTTHTPGSYAAGAASGASVILSGVRTSANSNGVAPTQTAPTNWTEPTNAEQGTSSGNARQQGAELSYRVAQTGTITPGTVGHTPTSFAIISHAFAVDATAYSQTITDTAGATDSASSLSAISTLTDTFGSLDTGKWTFSSGVTAAGTLVVPCQSSYPAALSVASYDLTGSSAMVNLLGTPAIGNGTAEAIFALVDSTGSINSAVRFNVGNGFINFQSYVGGTPTDSFLAYSATDHAWLRFSESGGNITWETSPDASTWTTRRTWAYPGGWPVGVLRAGLQSGYYGTETAPGSATFDNFNTAPVSGTAYTQTVTDTAGATDSQAQVSVAAQTVTDTAGAADSQARVAVYAPTLTDTAGAADSWAAATARTLTDTADAVDSQVQAAVYAQAVTDTAGAADSRTQASVAAQTVTDTAGATDSTTLTSSVAVTVTDTAGAADSSTYAAGQTATSTDTVGAADSQTQAAIYVQTLTDAAGVTDSRTQIAIYSQAVTDTAGATDSTSQASAAAQTITDAAGATDSQAQVAVYAPTLTDTAGAADSRSTSTDRPLTDTAGAADSTTLVTTYAQTVTDDAAVGDSTSVSAAGANSASFTDTAGAVDSTTQVAVHVRALTDAAGATDSWSAGTERSLTDTAGAVDSTAPVMAYAATITDAAGAADSITQLAAIGFSATVTDTAGAVDAVAATRGLAITVTDTAGAADSTASVGSSTRTLTDTAGAADLQAQAAVHAQTVTDAAGAADTTAQSVSSGVSATITDAAGVTDTVLAARDLAVTVTDTIGASDAADSVSAAQRVLDDAASVVDSANPALDAALTLLDTIGASDTTTYVVGLPLVVHATAFGYGSGLAATRHASGLTASRPRALGIRATRQGEFS